MPLRDTAIGCALDSTPQRNRFAANSLNAPDGPHAAAVFISYPRDGAAGQRWAADIERWLRSRALACFRDDTELDHVNPLSRQIEEHVDRCRLVLCIVSATTHESTWVRRELTLADQRQPEPASVVHVLVELGARPPAVGVENLTVDFTRNADEGWRALARAVGLPADAPAADRRELEVAYLRDSLRRGVGPFAAPERLFSEIGGVEEHFATLARWLGEDDLPLSARHESRRLQGEQRHREDVLDALREAPRFALLGPPGAGKTYALCRVGAELARRALDDPAAPLPVLVRLGGWLETLPECDPVNEAIAGNDVADASLRRLLADALGPQLAPHLDLLEQEERLALLLDGLNEMPAQGNRARRDAVVRWVRTHAPDEHRAPSVLLLSCRVGDFPRAVEHHLDTLTLLPLEPLQVKAFIERYLGAFLDESRAQEAAPRLFWHLAGGEEARRLAERWQACGRGAAEFFERDPPAIQAHDPAHPPSWLRRMLGRLPGRARPPTWSRWEEACRTDLVTGDHSLLKLARRPFVLRQMIGLFLSQNCSTEPLAGNRLELCGRFVDDLLAREYERLEGLRSRQGGAPPPPREAVLAVLERLAWTLQGARGEGALATATALRSEDAARPAGKALNEADRADCEPWHALELARNAQILELAASVRFAHQLLQEYFATGGLEREVAAGHEPGPALWPPERWWQRSGWEEVARFLAIRHADDPQWIIDRLADAQPRVLADCLREPGITALSETQREFLRSRWKPRMQPSREPAPAARNAVALALGRLGLDDRQGVGLSGDGLPELDWVVVPAGRFVYQDGERGELPEYRLARYPVTNVQYQAFVEDGGYAQERWWRGLARRIEHPNESYWDEPNRPRTDVSWYEAVAYCRWLTERRGEVVRLPVEQEWEKAARGEQGQAYPWGPEYQSGYANVDEILTQSGEWNLGETTVVGVYPQGASPYGVLDLSGNVWEWCLNDFDEPNARAKSVGLGGKGERSLRGGSFDDYADLARCDFRSRDRPNLRDDDVGFRLCCASPIRKR